MKKKTLVTVLSASLVCAAAAVAFAACGEETLYNVTYAGGGTNVTGAAPTEVQHKKGDKFTLKDNTFTNTGFEFAGWTYNNNVYAAGAQFTMPASDVNFTAKWAELFTVTYEWGESHFEADGVTLPEAQVIADGKQIALPAVEAQEKYTFAGWKVGETETVLAAGTQYTVTGSVTLTAVFEKEGFYTVVFLESEDATEGTSVEYEATEKLGTAGKFPTNITDSENFFVNEWAVKGNAEEKADGETLISELVGNAVGKTITLFPVSYHLEVGAKDFSNNYAIAPYSTTITQGEKVEVTGKMTSDATQNFHTIFAVLWSGETPNGAFRMDNWVNDNANGGAGADMSAAEKWGVIQKDANGINWDNFKTVIADCNVKITYNWISDSKIIVTLVATKADLTQTMVYTIVPASGQTFAESYKLGFGSEKCYIDLTELNRHTHVYGNDDVCTEEGCDQVNPVHTAHNYVYGICSVCSLVCNHAEATETNCSTCGASFAKTTRTETANLPNFSVNGLINNLTLQNNQDIVIEGTQTSTGANAWLSMILESTTAQITIRTDNYGWIFDKNNAQIETTGMNANPANNNQLVFNGNGGKVLKNNTVVTLDWADVTKIKNNCDWTVTLKLRDKKLSVEINMVGKAAEAQGWIYNIEYNFTLKTVAPSVQFTIGGENANLAASNSTVVTYPAQ